MPGIPFPQVTFCYEGSHQEHLLVFIKHGSKRPYCGAVLPPIQYMGQDMDKSKALMCPECMARYNVLEAFWKGVAGRDDPRCEEPVNEPEG
jgi:hypothetical protein